MSNRLKGMRQAFFALTWWGLVLIALGVVTTSLNTWISRHEPPCVPPTTQVNTL